MPDWPDRDAGERCKLGFLPKSRAGFPAGAAFCLPWQELVYRGKSLIVVMKALPQSSHDQAWSIRPPALNRDSSATSRMLSQRGHFGRLKFSVA
jgi:hypothetical protein